MPTRILSNTAIIALALLIGACINLEDIRRAETVRKVTFTGSFEDVALCVQPRVRGKLHRDPFRQEISVYNSVKGLTNRGISHFAMIITQTDQYGGTVEWRKLPEGPMQEAMIARFWYPVEDCVKEISRQADPEQSATL